MFGLFKDYDYFEIKIRLLQEELINEKSRRVSIESRVFRLEKQLKDIEKEEYNELQEKFYNDPMCTIKEIYDKYKYKKLDEVPYHIKEFITERYFIDLKDEKRVVGQILEDKHKDLLCGERKCNKKKGRKK